MPTVPETWRQRLRKWWIGSRRGAGDPLGAMGEREAEQYLASRGYQPIGRNLRFRTGEIDLLCLAPDERTIVIVEVKARARSQGVFRPEAAITEDKRRTLRRLASQVRSANGWVDRPIRIDVVAVELSGEAGHEVRHYEAAVRA
jgi:putative endonuclease